MKELHLSIVSPEKSVFDGEVNIQGGFVEMSDGAASVCVS